MKLSNPGLCASHHNDIDGRLGYLVLLVVHQESISGAALEGYPALPSLQTP
jgi:hypothetical protein